MISIARPVHSFQSGPDVTTIITNVATRNTTARPAGRGGVRSFAMIPGA
jgi:hypothetical protein